MIFYNKNWFFEAKFKTHKTPGNLEFWNLSVCIFLTTFPKINPYECKIKF